MVGRSNLHERLLAIGVSLCRTRIIDMAIRI